VSTKFHLNFFYQQILVLGILLAKELNPLPFLFSFQTH